MWRQVIDRKDAWPESSSSAMFSFAMISGVKNGWLDAKTYGPAARKAWIAVTGYVDQNADVTSVCAGTGKNNDLQYYFDRPRITGDYHGQAPVLWAASALLRSGSAQINGIAHVAFRVADLDAARNFYKRLGFEESFVFTTGEKISQVFVKINDRQFIELYPRTDPSQPLGWMHVCFEADGAEALHARYEERGLNPTQLVKGGAGNYIFTLNGPGGGLIEVTQYLPGSRHSVDRGQHLGAARISSELQVIKAVVPDLAAAERFYTAGLGFEKQKGGVRLSRDSDERMELEPANAKPQFVFRVADAKKTAAQLRALGFDVTGHGRGSKISDPDGNIFVFQTGSGR
jgi:catechol 2,3-dioxygenase-like lactoylglutathione lyase family enzyme